MGFSVYLQVFASGQPAGFRHEQIRHAFPGLLQELEPDYWLIRFSDEPHAAQSGDAFTQDTVNSDRSCDLFLTELEGDPDLIHSLSLHRPCADPRLWRGVFELLAEPGSVFHYPGDEPAFTRDPNLLQSLPSHLHDTLGQAWLLESAEKLRDSLVRLVVLGPE